MPQTTCRLCVNLCWDFRRLSNEICDLVVQYFDASILDVKQGVICLVCWRHICAFHNFQQMIHHAQKNFTNFHYYHPEVEIDVKSEVLTEGSHYGRHSSEMNEAINNMQLRNKIALLNGDTTYESSLEHHYTGNRTRETFINNSEGNIKSELDLMDGNSTDIHEPDETENYEREVFINDNVKKNKNVLQSSDVNFSGNDTDDYDDAVDILDDRSFHFDQHQRKILQTELQRIYNNDSRSKHLLKKQQLRTNETFNNTVKRKSNKQLDDLISRHKPNLECGICKNLCSNFDALRQHFKTEHPNDESYILCCDRQLNSRSTIEEHVLLHINPHAFRCEICGKFNRNRNSLSTHRNYRHPETRCRIHPTYRKRPEKLQNQIYGEI